MVTLIPSTKNALPQRSLAKREGYGEVTIKTQAAAIAKLPRCKVPL